MKIGDHLKNLLNTGVLERRHEMSQLESELMKRKTRGCGNLMRRG